MQKASIPHDALVFVGDGTRAVFFRRHAVDGRRLAQTGVLDATLPVGTKLFIDPITVRVRIRGRDGIEW